MRIHTLSARALALGALLAVSPLSFSAEAPATTAKDVSRKAGETGRAIKDYTVEQRDEAAEWYGGLKHSSAESWEQVKAGFVKSYEVLRQSFAKARKEL